ncbi:hypothetical protein ABPG77_003976 [Micractinium sp. CCAP 211/92]
MHTSVPLPFVLKNCATSRCRSRLIDCYPSFLVASLAFCAAHARPACVPPTGPSGGPPFGRAIGCMDFTPFSGHRVLPRQPAASVALSHCALHCHSSSIVDSTRRALCM